MLVLAIGLWWSSALQAAPTQQDGLLTSTRSLQEKKEEPSPSDKDSDSSEQEIEPPKKGFELSNRKLKDDENDEDKEVSVETKEKDSLYEVLNSEEGAAQPEENKSELAPPAGPRVLVSVELTNGTGLEGEAAVSQLVTRALDEPLVLWIAGEPMTIEGGRILTVQQISASKKPAISISSSSTKSSDSKKESTTEPSSRGFSYKNASSSRYLYSPSSMALKKGEGYISQKELFFTSVAYGVTDHLTVLGGTLTFFPPALTIAGMKYARSVSSRLHFSVGGEIFVSGLSGTEIMAAVGYAGVTFGDEDVNISINAGGGQIFKEWGIPVIVAGSYRFSDRFALVSENWLITTIKNSYSWDGTELAKVETLTNPEIGVVSLVGRVMGRRSGLYGGTQKTLINPSVTVDYGLIKVYYNDGFSDMLPWIDWSWAF